MPRFLLYVNLGGGTMLSIYPACFFKEGDSYSVIFPDLDYLATYGSSLDDAMAMAVDCLAGYIYTCKMDGDTIPKPSDIRSINAGQILKEVSAQPAAEPFVNMVSVDAEAYAKAHFEKSVRKSLTIPAWLNDAALEQGINFSQTLQEALLSKIRSR